MSEITDLLDQMSDDDPRATSALMARVYNELHRLAAGYMRRERGDHKLQTTALVHEAYLRLIGQRDIAWKNRAHFLGVAAQMMRRVLVDDARAHLCRRRGGLQKKVSLDDVCISPRTHSADLVTLDEALTRLAQTDARQAQIVELRFFRGADHGRNRQDAGDLEQNSKPRLASLICTSSEASRSWQEAWNRKPQRNSSRARRPHARGAWASIRRQSRH